MSVMPLEFTKGFSKPRNFALSHFRIFALLLALGIGTEVEAQGPRLRLPDAAFVGMGVSGTSTGELNDYLTAGGYPTFGRMAAAPSLGAYWSLPSGLMLGGEWHGLVFSEEPYEEGEVGLGGGYGTLGVGYLVELSSRARVYPRLGLGGGGLGLWIENEVIDFDEALTEPSPERERQSTLSRGSMVLDVGAGIELLPGGRGLGPLIGLRFGYLATPFSSDWQLDDFTVTGGPGASLAGPYVRVVVGGGRR